MDEMNQDRVSNTEVGQTENQNQPEAMPEANTTNQGNEVATASNKNDGIVEGGSLLDSVINQMVDEIKDLVHHKKQDAVGERVRNVLATVCAMSRESEYSVGIRINGELWRFNEFQAPEGIVKLVAPKRVVVSDVGSARDFLDRGMFKAKGRLLNPSQFGEAIRFIQSNLHVNPNQVPVSRSDIMLLQDAAKYAVKGGKVADRTQDTIIFLTIWCDDEARITLRDWARDKAAKLFV